MTNYVLSFPGSGTLYAMTGYTKLPAELNGKVYFLYDADGDFSSGATSTQMTLSGTDWIVTGVDLDDGMYFTVATNTPPAPG